MQSKTSIDWNYPSSPEESFDFEKVHKAMVAVGWTWSFKGVSRVPTLEEVKEHGLKLLAEARKSKLPFASVSTGGFTAYRGTDENGTDYYGLKFTIESKEDFH